MQNPWDQFPIELQGDEDATQLYIAVGQALSKWETLEESLGILFGVLCGTTSESAARAYGVVASSSGRVAMLREAFASSLVRNSPEFATFGVFLNRVNSFGSRRNDIAHGIVKGATLNEKWLGYHLVPPKHHSKKTMSTSRYLDIMMEDIINEDVWNEKMFGKYAYVSNQIHQYMIEFHKLNDGAVNFLMEARRLIWSKSGSTMGIGLDGEAQ